MRTINSNLALGVLVLLLTQGAAEAAGTDARAVAACAGAIAERIESRQGAGVDVKIDTSGIDESRRLINRTVFELDVRDPASSRVVGRFSCIVSGNAKVRRLVTLPLTAPDAIERARG